jgi:hypothetical protein
VHEAFDDELRPQIKPLERSDDFRLEIAFDSHATNLFISSENPRSLVIIIQGMESSVKRNRR